MKNLLSGISRRERRALAVLLALILAGHLHAGQIVLPYGFGKLLLAHPGSRYPEGVFERDGTTMHVSPGLGTTFVPFRFFARPEATELVLRCA